MTRDIEEEIINKTAIPQQDDDDKVVPSLTKRLLCVRHGISEANEWFRQPGNHWGAPNFRDGTQIDAPLSVAGRTATRLSLQKQLSQDNNIDNNNNNNNNNNSDNPVIRDQQQQKQQMNMMKELAAVELIVISPLTRCLETFEEGVKPMLLQALEEKIHKTGRDSTDNNNNNNKMDDLLPPIVALPLLRERVFTTSDIGRSVSILSKEFPNVDFKSYCRPKGGNANRDDGIEDIDDDNDDAPWWYTCNNKEKDGYEEWRPKDQDQWYGVPGEPEDVFEERMRELDAWIANRPEKTIMLVAHWGVFRHLSNGTEWQNAELKILEHTVVPGRRTSIVKEV